MAHDEGSGRRHDHWAHLRFAIIGPLLAAPPTPGALQEALTALAARTWQHPTRGGPVRFARSTIERWYYQARNARVDPVGRLRRQVRRDAGQQLSMGEAIGLEIAALQLIPRLVPSVIENRLAEWRRLLRQSITQGRGVLQRVVRKRITFTPNGEGYDFEANTRFDKLFTGIIAPRPKHLTEGDVRGAAHITAADTLDVDYGELLDRTSNGKVLASPSGRSAGWSVPSTRLVGLAARAA